MKSTEGRVAISKKALAAWGGITLVATILFGISTWNSRNASEGSNDNKEHSTRGTPTHSKRPTREGPQLQFASPAERQRIAAEARQLHIDEFYAASTTNVQKWTLLQQLIESAAETPELLRMIDTLPEGERSIWWAKVAEQCAVTSPEDYFKIINKLASGASRLTALGIGVSNFDGKNLKKLIDTVTSAGDREELTEVADCLRQNNPNDSKARPDELIALARENSDAGLRSALAYAAGQVAGLTGGDLNDQKIRSELGDKAADEYLQGKYTQVMKRDSDAFVRALSTDGISDKSKSELIRTFADENAGTKSISDTLAPAKKMSPDQADVYYQEVGTVIVFRDSMAASKIISNLPEGRSKEVIAAQLVKYLLSKGDKEGAAQWETVVVDKTLLKRDPHRP